MLIVLLLTNLLINEHFYESIQTVNGLTSIFCLGVMFLTLNLTFKTSKKHVTQYRKLFIKHCNHLHTYFYYVCVLICIPRMIFVVIYSYIGIIYMFQGSHSFNFWSRVELILKKLYFLNVCLQLFIFIIGVSSYWGILAEGFGFPLFL